MAQLRIIFVTILTAIGSELIPVQSETKVLNSSSTARSRQPKGSIELSHLLSSLIIRRKPGKECSTLNGEIVDAVKTPMRECQFLSNDQRVKYCWETVRYPWFKDENGAVFGHREECASPLENTEAYVFCHCVHTGSKFDGDSVVRSFSLRSQESDTDKNMVVTNAKIALRKAMIHLKIEESKLLSSGDVDGNAFWKSLGDIVAKSNSSYDPASWTDLIAGEDYISFTYEQRTMYLDEIYVPDEYIVTGVRFAPIISSMENPGIKLQIRGTKYDPSSYKLRQETHQWFDHDNNALNDDSYKRPRAEILLDNCDVPSNSAHNVESDTNKFVKFTTTDVKKDLADHVIPFLRKKSDKADGQLPLQGMAMAYTGAVGSGGFISLKLLPRRPPAPEPPTTTSSAGSSTAVSNIPIEHFNASTTTPSVGSITPVSNTSIETANAPTTKPSGGSTTPVSNTSIEYAIKGDPQMSGFFSVVFFFLLIVSILGLSMALLN